MAKLTVTGRGRAITRAVTRAITRAITRAGLTVSDTFWTPEPQRTAFRTCLARKPCRMKTLRSPRCTLEPQVEAHAAEMYPILCDPAIYEYEGVPPPSLEKLANGLRRREAQVSPDGREQWLNWVVRLPSGKL